jgi:hypothetical protein
LHDGLVANQWLAAPVLGDEREQLVFDPVPFAGARVTFYPVIEGAPREPSASRATELFPAR